MEIFGFINKFIEILVSDHILNLRLVAYLVLALVFLVPFFISKWFEHIIFRIILVIIGISYLEQWGQTTITRDFNFLIGMGLISPHIKYFFILIKDTCLNILIFFYVLFIQLKNATVNTYFFFITIYYKILRLINWFINIFIVIKTLIDSLRERFKKSSKEYEQENDFSSKNSNNEKAYEDFKKSHGYNESKKESSSKEKSNDKYKQFYSNNPYEVLGVKADDNFSIIKKSYRALIRIYHPDLNPEDIELFTEITQNLNNAYEKLQKYHKQ